LSVEIVIIALGTVIEETLTSQIVVVSFIAVLATVGVYGIVAVIVRMDELGFKLIGMSTKENSPSKIIGNLLVQALPKVIKSLAVIGTIALILVAGGIFVHNIDFLHHILPQLPSIAKEFIIGLAIGLIVLGIVTLFKKMFGKK
jgi:predicted DNA repair protein MutK